VRGHVARMGKERSVQGFGRKARGDHLEDRGVDGRMGSKWTLGWLGGGSVDSAG
jgi:hypothetical protein